MSLAAISVWRDLFRLIKHIGSQRRRQFAILLLLSIMSALAEMATLGAVVPFLALLAGLSGKQLEMCETFATLCGLSKAHMSWLFIAIVVTALILRLLALKIGTKFTYGLGEDLGNEIYRKTLYQPYQYHASKNTSVILSGVNKATLLAGYVVSPLIQGGISLVTAIAIFLTLIAINVQVALIAMGTFSVFYMGVFLFSKKRLQENGLVISKLDATKIQALQEGLGGIRDIILDSSQQIYLRRLGQINKEQSGARGNVQFLQSAPRYIIEAAGIILIVGLAWWIDRGEGISSALPTLGALALGAQRLLPLLQHVYHAAASIHGGHAFVHDVVALMDLPGDSNNKMQSPYLMQNTDVDAIIELKSVSFCYLSSNRPALENIDLLIRRGSRVGFIGKTGSGKSTLVDLIMGLLDPSSGERLVEQTALTDGNRFAWYRRIAHVPQSIYLADASLTANIAYGVDPEKIDMEQVRWAVDKAQMMDFVCSLPDQFDTLVGERGVRLSGGQRQRIGLARALYKRADVIVLDEATSALDDATEREVMNAIYGLGPEITVLMIAHRLSTLESCETIYELQDGRIVRQDTYHGIARQHHAINTSSLHHGADEGSL